MIGPAVGLMAFHDGSPVECLFRVRFSDQGEIWRVKPLFVKSQTEREELFRRGDRLTPLHTQSR
jgi:hypothetical protein